MKHVQLGRTGRQVSAVGLGGSQMCYDKSLDKTQFIDLIQYAHELGITYFETAPSYYSEEIFGEALAKFDRSSYFLTTKIGRYMPGPILTRYDLTARRTEQSLQSSLAKLQTNYIDLIQIHDFEFAETCVEKLVTETLPFLDKMRQSGIIKHIGLASYDLAKMKEVVEKSPIKIDSILNHSRLNLVDQSFAEYIPYFKQERGTAIINSSALCLGLLSTKSPPPWLLIDERLKEACAKAVQMCQDAAIPIERLANSYSFKLGERLGVDVLLTGAATREMLDFNLKAYFETESNLENDVALKIRDNFAELPFEAHDILSKTYKLYWQELAAAKEKLMKL